MSRAHQQKSSVKVTDNRGVASRILRSLFSSLRAKGTGASAGALTASTALVLALLFTVVIAGSASAAPKSVDRFFGGPPSSLAAGLGGLFNAPRDVVVNETGAGAADPGDIYVLEQNNARVHVLASDGSFKRLFGWDVISSGAPGDVGVAFEICVVAASCRGGANGTATGQLNQAQGVVVDQDSGNVYVSDRNSRRIQMFDASGVFLRTWGWDVVASGPGNDVVAPVNEFEVCVPANGDVCKDGLAGAGLGQIGNQGNSGTLGVAVTPGDGNPLTGSVYLADTTNTRVNVYALDGTAPSSLTSPSRFASQQPRLVAVDSRGIVYASDSANSGEIERYDTAGVHGAPGFLTPIAASAANLNGAGATLGLEVDPDSDGAGADEDVLYVLRDPTTAGQNSMIRQFGPVNDPGALAAPTASDETHMATDYGTLVPNGFGLNSTTGVLYVASAQGTACGGVCHGIFAVDDDGTGSDISATGVGGSNATATSVDLVGTVDPADGLVRYTFEYSPDGTTYFSTPTVTLNGTGPVQVSHALTGLDPNSVYRVRLKVEKVLNPTTLLSVTSPDSTALTSAASPAVVTQQIGPRTETTALLRGTVDPNGSATNYWFEYGPDANYGSRIPIVPGPAGSGNEPLAVVEQLEGLVPGTAYHYRIVADGFGPPVNGADQVFSTHPSVESPPLNSRAYELVSPADKIGGAGVGRWGGGAAGAAALSGQPAHVGDRFGMQGNLGSVLVESGTAYATDPAFAQRTASGWVSHSPITHGATSRQSYRFMRMHAAARDLSKVTWMSNAALLRPFAELADWPTNLNAEFLTDWSGRWELVAPTDLGQMRGGELPTAANGLTRSVFSKDATHIAFSTFVTSGGAATPAGMAGPDDPSHPSWPDLVGGRAAYLEDVSAGLSDDFAGNGSYVNIGVCTDGTLLPEQNGSSLLEDEPCQPAGPRETLISSRGATLHPQVPPPNDSDEYLKNVVSQNGDRVFFLSPDPLAAGVPAAGCSGTGTSTLCPPQLYVRQRNTNGTVSTRWISRAVDGLFGSQAAGLTGTTRFAGASEDGDKVFFETTSPLTPDDPNAGCGGNPLPCVTGSASASSWDLYAYDLPDGPDGDPATPDVDPAGGEITRISGGPTGNGDCNVTSATDPNAVFGHRSLRFLADDAGRAYFTCSTAIPGVAPTANGTTTEPGGTVISDATNLYVYSNKEGEEAWNFVARLPKTGPYGFNACATTDSSGTASLLAHAPSANATFLSINTTASTCVRGTADGAFVTFWTLGGLTFDDPDASTFDAYAYDAESDDLARITAPQGGVGGSYLCNPAYLKGDANNPIPIQCNGDMGFGGEPLALLGVASKPLHEGDRIAFFQTRSRLLVDDVDNAYDVYQWRNGDLSLISTGDSAYDGAPGEIGGAFYKGNDETGRNVYLATNDKLSWQDVDAVLDIYTARAGGGIPQPDPPVICGVLAGACQSGGAGETAAPIDTGTQRGDDNADPGTRATLAVRGPTASARRRAARTGVLPVRVSVNKPGRVSATARGKIGRRVRVLGRSSSQLARNGQIAIRLNRAARKALASGRPLSVTVSVTQPGARSRAITVRLVRGDRS